MVLIMTPLWFWDVAPAVLDVGEVRWSSAAGDKIIGFTPERLVIDAYNDGRQRRIYLKNNGDGTFSLEE